MTLFNLGDIVGFDIGTDRYQATIIAYLPGSNLGKVIVGWKSGEIISPNAWAPSYEQLENPQFNSVSNVRDYVRAEWIYESNLRLISRQEQFKVGDKVKVAGEEAIIIVIDNRPQEITRSLLIVFSKPSNYDGHSGAFFLKAEQSKLFMGTLHYQYCPEIYSFIGSPAVWAHTKDVSLISPSVAVKSEGNACCKCKNFFPFSEPNQPNGTLVCYSCRKYPFYGSVIS